MEEKKSKKSLFFIIIGLTILIIGLFVFTMYEKVFIDETEKIDKNSPTVNTTTKIEDSTSLIDGVLPNDLSKYFLTIWDYEYLYNKYFTMQDFNEDKYLCFEDWCDLYNKFKEGDTTNKKFNPFDFVKIEDNNLFWNISGEWMLDKNITDEIKMFYIDSFEGYVESFIVLTANNILYRIEVGTEFTINYEEDKYILTNEIYNSYTYNKIKNLEYVNNIKFVGYPIECDGQTLIYFEVGNNIFVLKNNELIEVEKFVKSYYNDARLYYINHLYNTCTPNNSIININYDGTLYNIKNVDNSPIKVKYYFKVYESDYTYNHGNDFDLIIDEKDNLYVIDRNEIKDVESIKTLEVFDKVKELVSGKNEDEETIIKKIILDSGETIVLSK